MDSNHRPHAYQDSETSALARKTAENLDSFSTPDRFRQQFQGAFGTTNDTTKMGDSLEFDNLSAYLAAEDEEARTRLAQEHGRSLGDWYDPSEFCWQVEPPFERCSACWSWRRFPIAQRHLGFGWKRLCELRCECGCHAREHEVRRST
ncbi:MAG TPA: hypothetical protein VF167_08130 [Longimicrobiaceae bacterium]